MGIKKSEHLPSAIYIQELVGLKGDEEIILSTAETGHPSSMVLLDSGKVKLYAESIEMDWTSNGDLLSKELVKQTQRFINSTDILPIIQSETNLQNIQSSFEKFIELDSEYVLIPIKTNHFLEEQIKKQKSLAWAHAINTISDSMASNRQTTYGSSYSSGSVNSYGSYGNTYGSYYGSTSYSQTTTESALATAQRRASLQMAREQQYQNNLNRASNSPLLEVLLLKKIKSTGGTTKAYLAYASSKEIGDYYTFSDLYMLHPDNDYVRSTVQYAIAKDKYDKEEILEAKKFTSKAITLDPSQVHYYEFAAELLIEEENYQNAKIFFEEILKLDQTNKKAKKQIKKLNKLLEKKAAEGNAAQS